MTLFPLDPTLEGGLHLWTKAASVFLLQRREGKKEEES